MNDLKNKNEIILEKDNIENEQDNNNINNNNKIENEENDNLFETDLLKYNFDYATKFNSINYLNLNPRKKQKFLLLIFLMSSKLNFFNKIICLDRLYPIFNLEKNPNMVHYIISKLVKYIKTGRTSVHMVNTSTFFCNKFLSNNHNYFFVYNVITELKKINKYASFDKDVVNDINEYIKVKISCIEKLFRSLKNDENLSNLYKLIKNILSKTKNPEKKEIIKEEDNNDENKHLYIINRIWLENANLFLNNYFFSKKSKTIPDFLEDAFSIDNILSVLLSPKKVDGPIKDRTYYPFPGPINNLPLNDYKNILFDPVNTEENFLIKKNLEENNDYFWITKKEWSLIKDIFDATNDIKRKKNELEMIRINAIIFDYRMRKYKNESIDFMQHKVIQIGKNSNIKDLENKILRCMNYQINFLKIKYKEIKRDENNEDKVINLYKVNKINRDIIIEMFLSFENNITTYESVFFQEIILTEEDKAKNIEEIFNKFDSSREILILEINTINKESPKFLLPINNKELACSICKKPIKDLNDTKYMCELCSMYLFCSKECAQISNEKNNNPKILEHFKLHKFLSDLNNKPFNFEEFLKSDFNEEIQESVNKGEIGLYNLGNTCYMNCSLQCLSHTEDLTKYFFKNYFQNEINLESKFGSRGILLKSYSDIINLMWFSDKQILNPRFMRMSFIECTNKFGNNMQQDAMEFLSILLSNFHDDLNRIYEKPYIQLDSQKETETDFQASERYNIYALQRENSIIIDLFYGQFQNIIKCTECFKENKTYESFNNITLPIPEEHNFYIIKFFTQLKCKYITININSETTFGELIKKATKFLSKKILDALEEIKKEYNESKKYVEALMEKNIEIVKLDKNKVINVIYSQPEDEKDIAINYQKKLIKYINREEEIILFEREIIPEYHQNIYIYPITLDEKDDNKINFLSYPVVFPVKHDLTLENLEKIIVEKFSHILIDNVNINKSEHIIDLHILHWKRNQNTGIMKIIKDYPKCRYCGNDYSQKKFCPLYYNFNKKDTIATIFKDYKYSEPFVLLARSSYFDVNKEVYPGYYFEENNNLNKYRNLYDSLNQFGKFEFLGENNLWDCPQCQKKTKINKAIKIFRAPRYLIIQLKRFKKKSNGFFNFLEGDKNETFVSFPTKNLDLNNYIEGPSKVNSIYNLYAVINHKNISGCNHFTAFCLSNNKWVEFDDHKIIHDVNTPVTSDAYILFYSKKK